MVGEIVQIQFVLGEKSSLTWSTSEGPVFAVCLTVPAQLPVRGELLIAIITLVFLSANNLLREAIQRALITMVILDMHHQFVLLYKSLAALLALIRPLSAVEQRVPLELPERDKFLITLAT